MTATSDRYAITIPPELSPAYREAIELETARLQTAVREGDDGLVLGQLKSLVESVAKVVLDLNGTPAEGNTSFESVLRQAHDLLANQRGHELSHTSAAGNIATQARKIAGSIGDLRNAFGSGHGRARTPQVAPEMLALAVDGSLLWVRWALLRVGYFAIGRPEVLIRDLIGDDDGPSITFRSGELRARLLAAGLPDLVERHARAIGVAVGQRAARGTFVVAGDGVDPCWQQPDDWPEAYRTGVVHGLLFDPWEQPSLTAVNVLRAIRILRELPSASAEVQIVAQALRGVTVPTPLPGEQSTRDEIDRQLHELGQPANSENHTWAEFGSVLRLS